jgi:hypothetical protein
VLEDTLADDDIVLEDTLAGDDIVLGDRETKSHVLMESRASYSSIARCQWGSTKVLRIEVWAGDNVRGAVVTESCR